MVSSTFDPLAFVQIETCDEVDVWIGDFGDGRIDGREFGPTRGVVPCLGQKNEDQIIHGLQISGGRIGDDDDASGEEIAGGSGGAT